MQDPRIQKAVDQLQNLLDQCGNAADNTAFAAVVNHIEFLEAHLRLEKKIAASKANLAT